MSEYQYYEFQAVDRSLSDKEQAELRKLSSRAEISAYSFSNVYHWGDFKGSPDQMMERYFDAHVYVANWGTRIFMLRVPRRLFETERARPYLTDEGMTLWTKGDNVILRFGREEEAGEWEEGGEHWLAALLGVRAELLSRDLRALYLGWLACANTGELAEDEEEPPVPPGLRSLSAALTALADFLAIPEGLIEAAAQASPEAAPAPKPKELEAWVHALPASEKDALLLRLMEGTEPLLGAELLQRFRQGRAPSEAKTPASRRTVKQLLAEAEALEQARKQREKERRAAARAKELEVLAAREPEAWKELEQLFATRRASAHQAGVQLLVKLRDVARRQGSEAEFNRRLHLLREQNARRAGLIARMNDAGLSLA